MSTGPLFLIFLFESGLALGHLSSLTLTLLLTGGTFPVESVLEMLRLPGAFRVQLFFGLFLKVRFMLAGLERDLVAGLGFLLFPFISQVRLFLAVLGF